MTKDGQTTTTARIPFAQGINSTLVTDSTNTTSGSIITAGGVGIAKALYVGTTANVTGVATFSAQPIFSSLTASSAVATDASKGLVSVTNTGTGNNVLATAPTIASLNLTTALTIASAAGTAGQALTSGGSGNAPTWATPSGGKILQVLSATYSTVTSTSTTTYADSGLTVSITPSSATSKVLVFVSVNGVNKSGVDCCLNARLNRDATSISNITGLAAYTGSTGTGTGSASFNYLDSPASTSSIEYKLQIASSNAGRSVSINDYAAMLGSVSAITVMEIAA
jgi:hypothetical protein